MDSTEESCLANSKQVITNVQLSIDDHFPQKKKKEVFSVSLAVRKSSIFATIKFV